MQNDNARLKKPRNNNQSDPAFVIVPNKESLSPEEFQEYQPHPDFWGVQAERFRKGLTQNPVVVEQPKNEVNLSRLMQQSTHYFEFEDVKKRSIVCNSCVVKHGGILDAKNLIHYRLEDGVLYFKGKPINRKP